MGFTDFFLDYIPMYDKFRAVSSILVIAEFTIPLLAMLALKQIIARPQIMKRTGKGVLYQFWIDRRYCFAVCTGSTIFLSFLCVEHGNAGFAEYSG